MSYNLTDFKDENDYDVVDEGKYEAIIEKFEIKVAKSSGNEYVSIQYRIRSDVDQKYGNRVIFDILTKESTGDFFNRKKLTRLIKAAYPINPPLDFATLDDIFNQLLGKKIIINVRISENEYNGEKNKQNYVYFYEPTKFADKTLDNVKDDDVPPEDDDEGLPF